jgi:hypothetical protein
MNEVLGYLGNSPIHRQTVLSGGDDQVYFANEPILIYVIMVEEGTAGSFARPNSLQPVDPRMRAQMVGKKVRIFNQGLDFLEGSQNLDQASLMVEKRRLGSLPPELAEFR